MLFSKKTENPFMQSIKAETIRSSAPQEAAKEPSKSELPNQAKQHTPLTHRMGVKAAVFILVILMILLTIGSVFSAVIMLAQNIYTTPEISYRRNKFEYFAEKDARKLAELLCSDDPASEQNALEYLVRRNIASVVLTPDSHCSFNHWNYNSSSTADSQVYSYTFYKISRKDGGTFLADYEYQDDDTQILWSAEVKIRLAKELTEQDHYYLIDFLISVLYSLRYWIYAIGAAALILAIAGFVFLLCASGHKKGFSEPKPSWGTKIPIDLLTLGVCSAAFLLLQIIVEAVAWKQIAACGAAGIFLIVIVLGWFMSVALRIKLGILWKNSIVFHVLRLVWMILKKLWFALRYIGRNMVSVVEKIPLIWKTTLGLALIAFVELFAILLAWYEPGILLLVSLCKNLLLCPFVLIVALMLRKLQQGGKALATGDLNYQVDTTRMLWDFKQHGENLNCIRQGMTLAVEQRLKSERMKTELITNVSHDLKTPLTSIINYADLIEKESCENPAIIEYASVLHRQSERLKRLIDDLVEASKASTGNLEILLSPCEVGVMLTQTSGEYEQRLQERNLELVTKQPDQPIQILADGRRLWRVFDNLMNNICKYGQSGTRVYLTLEEQSDQAMISFKNTSREPLNLSPDQLMERFIQGDSSRNTEGNGLGLSIAKSLTELQNGNMELSTDGDLFKVILRFPIFRQYSVSGLKHTETVD